MSKRSLIGLVMVLSVVLLSQRALANNMAVTNVVFYNVDTANSNAWIQFDVSWDNSWRIAGTCTNWDAAWVFIKYKDTGGAWHHANLSTNASDHTAASGSTLDVGLTGSAGMGAFVYRAANGTGNNSFTGMRLRWDYSDTGLDLQKGVTQQISVHAIEMVYVPQGSFYVGDGTTTLPMAHFCSNTTVTVPFQITNENYEITLGGGTADSLGNSNNEWGADDFDDLTAQTLPAAFPKGYNAFYCMKYDISEGQWVSFFNMLTDSQKTTRDITRNVNGGKNSDGVVYRNTVAWTTGDATTAAPDRGCNYLSWADGVAYADWAGLRPMTELEYEKACRGPLTPVANELAWGTTVLKEITGFSGADGSGTETASPATANCNHNNKILGPVRCGIFATSTSGRQESGATYWGIMEMTGNLRKRPVTVGNATGRAFSGAVGDGKLNAAGDANADYWPGTSGAGAGFRGGKWNSSWNYIRVSRRQDAASVSGTRSNVNGFRGVR